MNKATMPPMAGQAQSAASKQTSCDTNHYNKHYSPECPDIVSFTLYTKKRGNLTKTISLDGSGKLIKDSSACWLANGSAETIEIPFSELPAFFGTIKRNQAIGGGICKKKATDICSMSQQGTTPDDSCITRTKNNFYYAEGKAGVLLLDNDCGIDNNQLIAELEKIVPGLDQAAKIIKPSVSAGLIRKSSGEALPGKNNAHIYVLVQNAADIPRFGKVLHQKLIISGHGRVEFAKDGKILIRSLVDSFVHSPERLDFAAPPILIGDLEQRLPEIQYLRGEALDTSELEDLDQVELIQFEKILRDLRKDAEEESCTIREKYIHEMGAQVAKAQNISPDSAREIIRNRTNNILSGDDIILFDDGTSEKVREILKEPAKFDGKTLPDPIEPEYGGGRNKAILFANSETGNPIIHSFAHGERLFRLLFDFVDLEKMFNEAGSDALKNWPQQIAKGHLDDDEQDILLNLLNKKIGGTLKKMRGKLESLLASKRSQPNWGEPAYETPEYAFLNVQYGVVMMGSKAVIIEEIFDSGLKAWGFTAYRPSELVQYYENVRVLRQDGKGDHNIFQLWMRYRGRNTFEGIEFRPDPTIFRDGKRTIQQGGTYNLWQGYMVAPVKGDCSLIMDHILKVWCNDDNEMFVYFLNWLADMFQHPNRQGKTALVLRSGQGAGKNIIIDGIICRILGCHALIATKKEDFLGRFNGLLGQAVFVFANEAVWAGDREKQGTLKGLITDDFLTIEKKFIDSIKVPNYSHLMFASNESWVVPADIDDRRFVYADVSDRRKGDSEYFKKLGSQINDEGRAAFLFEMLTRDLSGVDLTKPPENQSPQRLTDQLQTAPLFIKFFFDLLSNPEFESYAMNERSPRARKTWVETGWTPLKDDFYQMYLAFCQNVRHQHPGTKDVLIRNLTQTLPGMLTTKRMKIKTADRLPCLVLPGLSEARALFAKKLKLDIKWEN